MKPVFIKLLIAFIFIAAAVYLLVPPPPFPNAPPNSIRSNEPGDTESIYRRAYYTNYTRSEILNYYNQAFKIPGLQYLLNYPPEQAFTLVRDQTKSSWLQEFVHPMRESLFVNGFYPTKPTEQINIGGVHYISKITVRYIPSNPVTRLTVLLLIFICCYWLYQEYGQI
jgi:hypothetical protein